MASAFTVETLVSMEKKKKIPEHNCKENAVGTRGGMFVSYYECKICGKEMRFSDPVD